MNKNKIRFKKNEKKPCDMYVLFNGKVTELIGTKIKFETKKISILNFEFNLI